MKKNILLFSLLLLSLSSLSAQTLSRQVISATGSSNNQLSYTLGEPVIETAIGGSFILTQGFQQPDGTTVNVKKPIQVKIDYKLYPNPAHDKVILELNSTSLLNLKVDIVDMAGKQVQKAEAIRFEGKKKNQFDVSGFASGSYLMRITTHSNEVLETIKFERGH